MSSKRAISAVLAVALMLVGFAVAPVEPSAVQPALEPAAVKPDSRFSKLRDELKAMVDSGELVSLAVGVIVDGRVTWAEAWGSSDKDGGIPATVETRYGLASLGKSITATAMMRLVEKKRISLETNVSRLLGRRFFRVHEGAKTPTVRQLLNMTSGIPHGAMTYTSKPYPTEHDMLRPRAIVVFEPGSVFHYSNFSMAVADRVIEKVSARTFEEFIHRNVFEPLDMTQASVGAPGSLTLPAARYDDSGKLFAPFHPLPRSSRQTQASVRDMLKYAAFHLKTPFPAQKPILSDASIEALHNQRSGVEGAHVALGWGSIDIGHGRRWIISSGNDMGLQSSLTLLPDQAVGVIVLTNSSGSQADEIGIKAADIVAPGFLEAATAAMGAFQARSKAYAPSPDWTGEWEGAIVSKNREIPVTMSFPLNGTIEIVFDGGPPQALEEAILNNGLLTGAFRGDLPLEEAAGRPHRIEICLHKMGEKMTGFALANFRNDRGKFELPTFFHLVRRSSSR